MCAACCVVGGRRRVGRTDGRTARLYFSALSPLSPRSSIVSTCGTRRRAINGENIYTTPCVDVKAAPLESPRDDRLIARGGGGGGGAGCCCVAGGLLCLAHRRRPDDRRCVALRQCAARHDTYAVSATAASTRNYSRRSVIVRSLAVGNRNHRSIDDRPPPAAGLH